MRLPRVRLTTNQKMIAVACVMIFYLAAVWWVNRHPDRSSLRHEEAKVLKLLGNTHTSGGIRLLTTHDTILTRFRGGVSRRDEKALVTIDRAGPTLGEKIAASRGRGGEPAEFALSPGVPVADLKERLGKPSSKYVAKYPYTRKSIEFYSYGNLDVGVLDEKTIVVRVR
jgi:hypothetical protein